MLIHYSVRVGPAGRGREGREDCTLHIKIHIIQKRCLELKGCERFYFRIYFWYAADIISHHKSEFPASSLLFVLAIESLVRSATASRNVKITGSQAGTRPICYKTITSIHLRLKWGWEDVLMSTLYPSILVRFVDSLNMFFYLLLGLTVGQRQDIIIIQLICVLHLVRASLLISRTIRSNELVAWH